MRLAPAIFAFLVVLAGTPPAARAAHKAANKQAVEKAAKKACITGDFRKGVDLLGDLFVETKDIAYVYNQGRCFEQNHRWEEAIDRFREYLRKASDLSGADKADVENHISECETQQAKLAPPPVVTVAAPPTPAPAPTVFQAPAPVATVNLAAPSSAEPDSGSGLRIAGIVTAAVGVLALGGGVFCNLEANSLTSQLNGSNYTRDKASRRDTYETLGWVGYGVGAAALVTGTTLFMVGWRSGKPAEASPAVALTPVFLPGFATLSLRGTY
jgi:hypothetical protein